MVRGQVRRRNRCDLNFYPPSSATPGRLDLWSGNPGNVMRNALLYQ